jgi:hypothetical protein
VPARYHSTLDRQNQKRFIRDITCRLHYFVAKHFADLSLESNCEL